MNDSYRQSLINEVMCRGNRYYQFSVPVPGKLVVVSPNVSRVYMTSSWVRIFTSLLASHLSPCDLEELIRCLEAEYGDSSM